MSEKKTVITTAESLSERYLLIEARWDKPFFRRFVFALRDQESLRQGIAGVSVVGIGLGVCKAAAADRLAVEYEVHHGGVQSPGRDLRLGAGLSETRRIAIAILQYAIAASVLMFYSKSLLGVALRGLVGS